MVLLFYLLPLGLGVYGYRERTRPDATESERARGGSLMAAGAAGTAALWAVDYYTPALDRFRGTYRPARLPSGRQI